MLDPESGRVMALIRQPGFDPNYFWQTEEQQKGFFTAEFATELIRPLLIEAAAIYDTGLEGNILPMTISVPAYGLTKEQLDRYWQEFGLDQPVQSFLPSDFQQGAGVIEEADGISKQSAVQLAVGLSALLNSGLRVSPWLLKAFYDHDLQRFFTRDVRSSPRKRVIWPAAGVHLRWQLLHHPQYSNEKGFLFQNRISAVGKHNGLSNHHLQEVFLAAAPRENPTLLLLMAVDYGTLYPQTAKASWKKKRFTALGQDVFSLLTKYAGREIPALQPPGEKNGVNLRRFFLRKKVKLLPEETRYDYPISLMPNVIGLSLRKGLQELNLHDLKIHIRGSGQIIAQKPAAGKSLATNKDCELILEPNNLR
ncbi:MAG: hypothetical protein D3923_16010 [Candidatus Electrothrix sp. AR3]|nr:hypothetical protein [Candidatus Electrothrix sp. AR3]